MSLRGRLMIEEGCKLKAYPDPLSALALACQKAHISIYDYRKLPMWRNLSGKPWTIGYGYAHEEITPDTVWTQQQADDHLDITIEEARTDLRIHFPWTEQLDTVRKEVLVDMCFNMGSSRLAKFKNTLAAFKERRWEDAADGMLASLWAKQVGSRATVLARIVRTGIE